LRVSEVLDNSSVKLNNPLATLQQYSALITAHHGSSSSKKLCLRGYGDFLIEGMELFTESISDLLNEVSVNPAVEFKADFLDECLANVKVTDVCKSVKDKVDQIIKEERKKLLKVVGKSECKEDDLLNMSNLGMSLLTLSDGHNTSEQELFEPETPRMLNDNLLDFENQYVPDKDYKMKTLNLIEKTFENKGLLKGKYPIQVEPLLVKGFNRKGSNETFEARGSNTEEPLAKPIRYSVQPPGMIKNNSDLGAIMQSERSELSTMVRSTGGAMRRELPASATIEKGDHKKTFADFFVGRSRANTGDVTFKPTDFLKKTNDNSSQHARGNSVNSNNSSIEGRQRAESDLMTYQNKNKEKDRALKLAVMRKIGQSEANSQCEKSDFVVDKDSKLPISRKSTQGKDRMASPIKDNFNYDSKSMNLKFNTSPDLLLTPMAKKIMNTRDSHRSINSKYQNEVFKMMDSQKKSYDFSNSQMGDEGINFLAKYIKGNHEIDTLRLDNCKISDDGLSILLHSMMSVKVDKLYLRNNLITKDGVELIKKFISMKKIIHLINLKGNPLADNLMTAYIKEFSVQKVILVV
jgi:hypothetical protein